MIDIHLNKEERGIALQRVGISGYTHAMVINNIHTVSEIAFTASLPMDERAIHMSRLTQLLQDFHSISNSSVAELFDSASKLICSNSFRIEIKFTYFVQKLSPTSSIPGELSYKCCMTAEVTPDRTVFSHKLVVPVCSVCPCSKAISDYGAHNQRGIVTAVLNDVDASDYDDIIATIESSASSGLYSVLKRPDEKFVTESSYRNAKFVEDIARDVVINLRKSYDGRLASISVQNSESIHNHNAIAEFFPQQNS